MRFRAAAVVALLSGFHAASAAADAPCSIDAAKLLPSDGASSISSESAPLLEAWAECVAGQRDVFVATYAGEALVQAWGDAFKSYALTPGDLPEALPNLARVVEANFFSTESPVRDLKSRVAELDGADAPLAADLRVYLSYLQIAIYLWDETRVWMMEEAWPGLLRAYARKAAHTQRRDGVRAEMERLAALWQRLGLDVAKEQADSAMYQALSARAQEEDLCVQGLEAATGHLMWRIEVLSLMPHAAPFEGDLREAALPQQPPPPPEPDAACAWSLEPSRSADGSGG